MLHAHKSDYYRPHCKACIYTGYLFSLITFFTFFTQLKYSKGNFYNWAVMACSEHFTSSCAVLRQLPGGCKRGGGLIGWSRSVALATAQGLVALPCGSNSVICSPRGWRKQLLLSNSVQADRHLNESTLRTESELYCFIGTACMNVSTHSRVFFPLSFLYTKYNCLFSFTPRLKGKLTHNVTLTSSIVVASMVARTDISCISPIWDIDPRLYLNISA